MGDVEDYAQGRLLSYPVTMLEPDDAHVSLVFTVRSHQVNRFDYETSTRISDSGLRISTSIGWTCTMLRRRLHLFLFFATCGLV
jgi:hypothetical protein